jgi:hypothetical protein
MEQSNHNSPLLLIIAWMSHLVSYAFDNINLHNVSLVFSIVSSLVYIYINLIKPYYDKKINNKRSQ